MRRAIRVTLACLLLLAVPALAEEAEARPPSILFLLSDDQQRDTIRAWGNQDIVTPSLDALAARGFSFRRNYCMGSMHGAVCQPSRAMTLTGRTLWRVPMNLRDVKTMPEHLRDHGYLTFGAGKWHNGRASFERCFDRGTSVMLGGMSNHEAVPVRDLGPDGKLGEVRAATAFSSELFADAAIGFLRSHPAEEQPFFAWIAFTAPHDPRQPPEPFLKRYHEDPPALPPSFLPQHPFDNGWLTVRDEKLAAWPRTPEVISDQLAEYHGMITHLDAQVERILETLEETGHADRTIVVYASDHGLAVGRHGLLGKQSLYEHSVGCPLILSGPGVPQGDSRSLTYLHDVFPTLCDLVGVPVPEAVEGESLAPVIAGDEAAVRDTLFTAFQDDMRAIRDDRWKLIRYPQIDHTQLFDLLEDPWEMRDLADEPEHSERVGTMTELLQDWQATTGDAHPLVVAEPRPAAVDLTNRPRKPDRWQPEWIVEKYFAPARPPNIVLVLADDLGIGDLGCYSEESRIPTPSLDRLAAEGVRFTDAHSPSGVCTPTRYGVLTGRYAWRTMLKKGVLGGRSPNLIDPARVTMPELLRTRGYRTAGVGKWHLGIGDAPRTDYSLPLCPGPVSHGFDSYFGIPASLDMPPYVFIMDEGVEEQPTADIEKSDHRRQDGGGFWRGGKIAPSFRHADVMPRILDRAVATLEAWKEEGGDRPFFLYVPLSAPHTPWLPLEELRGASEVGHYGDFVAQVDHDIGELMAALERLGLAQDTLLVVTSDNGSHWPDADIERWGHDANGGHRGQKADIWEGGHRVPFLARWPVQIPGGSVRDDLLCLTDLLATFASAAGAELPRDAAEDSFSQLAACRGQALHAPARDHAVHHSSNGTFALREGRWKLVLGRGSGGFTAPRRIEPAEGEPAGQLYDLEADPREIVNLWLEHPGIVARLTARLATLQSSGRSRR